MTSRENHESPHHAVRNVKIAAILNLCFTVIEFIGGALTNSLAILVNALHDLGDSMVLFSSWRIEHLAQKKPDWHKTFGYRRLSLLAASLNAVVLLGGSLVITFQVIGRLIQPQEVHPNGMIGLAILGIVVNLFASIRLKGGGSLNEKVLSWHLIEDVLSWSGILIAAIVIRVTHWYIADPIVTLVFTLFVLWGVFRNSRELFNVFLEGVPSGTLLADLVNEIKSVPGVRRIYDAHLWSLDGRHHLASLKVLTLRNLTKEHTHALEKKIKEIFIKHRVLHSTVEMENEEAYVAREQEQEFLNEKD